MLYVSTVLPDGRSRGRRLMRRVFTGFGALALVPVVVFSTLSGAQAAAGSTVTFRSGPRETAVVQAVAPAPAGAAHEAAGSVKALQAVGVRVDVTVRRIYTRGQARWVDHVVDQNITAIDGCIPDPSDSRRSGSTYRVHVNLLCEGGKALVRRRVDALVAKRPWYRITVKSVPVVAFGFLADLDHGRGDPVGAALAELPFNDFTFVEGDDVSLTYVGTGVTQGQLDRARAAFAQALRIPVARVAVNPVTWG